MREQGFGGLQVVVGVSQMAWERWLNKGLFAKKIGRQLRLVGYCGRNAVDSSWSYKITPVVVVVEAVAIFCVGSGGKR